MKTDAPPSSPMVLCGQSGKIFISAVAFAILAAIGVIGVLRETDQFLGIFFALFAYVLSLVIPAFLLKDHAGWFHPIVFTACFSLMQMVRRASSYFDGMPEHAGIPGYSLADLNGLIWQLLLLQTLGQLAYCMGFLLGPRKARSILAPPRSDPSMRLAGVIALVGAFYLLFLRNKGGLEEHMLDLGKGRVRQIEETQLFGISVVVINLAMFALLALVAYARTTFHYALLAILGPAVLFMKYTVAGSRSSMIFAFLLCLMVRSIATRRIRWTTYIAGAVATVIAIGALGQLRRGTWKGNTGLDEAIESMTASDSFLSGISELEQRGSALNPVYPIMARVPDEVPYLLGRSYLTLVTAPIPRALWMNKPRTTGALVGQTFFDSDAGMPPGPIGEALWNFGIPGVVLVYLLFGMFHRFVFVWFMNHPSSSAAIAIYALTLLNLQPDVLSIITWFQVAFAGYVLCRFLGVVRSLPRNSRPPSEATQLRPALS